VARTAELRVSHRCIYDAAQRSYTNGDLSLAHTLTALVLLAGTVHCMTARAFTTADLNLLLLAGALYIGMRTQSIRKSARAREEFRDALVPQLEDRYVRRLSDAMHVGIAPGPKLNRYAGDPAWDVGFLVVEEGLLYYGDQTRFQLLRDDILEVQIQNAFSLMGVPRMLIQYRTAWNHPAWLAVDARDCGSRTHQIAGLHHLRAQIALLPKGERRHGFALPMTKVPIG
jgi:hypothetical protein